ncbi:MAG TPA: GNAT family N-acetyltransferase [Candidatus Udaeobacter sp.]|jgi:predicted N-acetyltransferase YhbS|nr:GNAT family N-acetyltransferase [Candidatus Udaeobacter sp.]
MDVKIRAATPDDAQRCGTICYEAFNAIANQHNFPTDLPSAEVTVGLLSKLIGDPRFYGVVAEIDGQVIGSNFMDERSAIAGIGPITIDPTVQNRGIGRALMHDCMARAAERRVSGVRLLQAGYHTRSLSLYTKMGFVTREPLATMQGSPLGVQISGYKVRKAVEVDLQPCNRVCFKVHGFDRSAEVLDAIKNETATVVEHDGHITGYATVIGFFGHAVAETNDGSKALIGAATVFAGPGFLLPMRNWEVFRWCLEHGLRVVEPMTLMSVGLYNEPAGAFLPSILF